MECIKTGAFIHLGCYGQTLYGDLFKLGDYYLMRVCQVADGAPSHFNMFFASYEQWFDRKTTSGHQNSTLILHGRYAGEFSYEGHKK